MIQNYQTQQNQCQERVTQKTLDSTFLRQIEKGANCPPFVSNAILDTAKHVYHLHEAHPDDALKPGQMKVIGVVASEPAGKRLSECHMKECVITFYAGKEDNEIRRQYGTRGLRRAKLLRIATESWEQGVFLSHEDFAYNILHCGLRTISRDIHYFRNQNIFVPTRGQQMDIGPGTSHKVVAVEGMIQRKSEVDIARMIYHSLKAIERYTLTFAKVVLLTHKGFSIDEIAFVVQISARLASEYQRLYDTYKDNPQYQERLQEIIGNAQNIDDLQGLFSKKNNLKRSSS
jgi:hypothetical protein